MCQTGGAAVPCQWNDTSQAEAYAHTLTAFYKAFPEYVANDLCVFVLKGTAVLLVHFQRV